MLVLFVLRFFVFHLYESPKFLMGRGRDAEAVEVVHKVAAYNGTTSDLTLDMLRRAEKNRPASLNGVSEVSQKSPIDPSRLGALRRKLREFGWDHVTPLFKTRKLARSTSLLITLWGASSSPAFFHLRTLNLFFSSHRPRFPSVSQVVIFYLATDLHQYPTRYNSFVTYLYDEALASPALLIVLCSLATRGADFGDGSTYLTYRNVSSWFLFASFITVLNFLRLPASHPERHWRTRRVARRMDGGASVSRTTRIARNLNRYVPSFDRSHFYLNRATDVVHHSSDRHISFRFYDVTLIRHPPRLELWLQFHE